MSVFAQQGIRFKSGTTAITVFDEFGHSARKSFFRPCAFCGAICRVISQKTCRFFFWFVIFGENGRNRKTLENMAFLRMCPRFFRNARTDFSVALTARFRSRTLRTRTEKRIEYRIKTPRAPCKMTGSDGGEEKDR